MFDSLRRLFRKREPANDEGDAQRESDRLQAEAEAARLSGAASIQQRDGGMGGYGHGF